MQRPSALSKMPLILHCLPAQGRKGSPHCLPTCASAGLRWVVVESPQHLRRNLRAGLSVGLESKSRQGWGNQGCQARHALHTGCFGLNSHCRLGLQSPRGRRKGDSFAASRRSRRIRLEPRWQSLIRKTNHDPTKASPPTPLSAARAQSVFAPPQSCWSITD